MSLNVYLFCKVLIDIFLSFCSAYKVVSFSGKSGSEQCAVVYPPNGEKTASTSISIIACPSMHHVLVHLLNSETGVSAFIR